MTNEEKAKHLASREMYGGFTLAEQNAAYQAAMEAMEWKDEQNTEFLLKLKNAFEGIARSCDKLTSGNIAHERVHLKCYVEGLAEMIERHLKGE